MSFEPIMYLGILIIAAKLLGEAMHRIGQPTIIGNVLAGIIVGPALFALVELPFEVANITCALKASASPVHEQPIERPVDSG